MNTQLWKFEKAEATSKRFGQPVDAEGHYLSKIDITQEALGEMFLILQELFAFLDEYDVDLLEDSEHACKGIGLGNHYEVTWTISDPTILTVLHRGRLVGKLLRQGGLK